MFRNLDAGSGTENRNSAPVRDLTSNEESRNFSQALIHELADKRGADYYDRPFNPSRLSPPGIGASGPLDVHLHRFVSR
jgi:hypothetical protein